MTPPDRPRRCCPKCQAASYLFRARRAVGEADGKFVETKYRCRACAHQWWDRAPVPQGQRPTDEAA